MTDRARGHGRRAAEMSRRRFLTASGAAAAGLAFWSVLDRPAPAGAEPARGPAARAIPFDTGWLFGPATPGSAAPGFDDSGLVTVTLPHTVTPLSWRDWDPASWEKVWVYRNHFDAPAGVGGMRVFLDFAAAMTLATPTLNGHELTGHLGG
ncbi:MAG: twin-arginine translocation signal domain-containing protein, partial [Actinoallomurus sp.]